MTYCSVPVLCSYYLQLLYEFRLVDGQFYGILRDTLWEMLPCKKGYTFDLMTEICGYYFQSFNNSISCQQTEIYNTFIRHTMTTFEHYSSKVVGGVYIEINNKMCTIYSNKKITLVAYGQKNINIAQ